MPINDGLRLGAGTNFHDPNCAIRQLLATHKQPFAIGVCDQHAAGCVVVGADDTALPLLKKRTADAADGGLQLPTIGGLQERGGKG